MRLRILLPFLFLCALLLCACAAQTSAQESPVPSAPPPETLAHFHTQVEDNVLPHEEIGYCGNTVTEIKAADWEASFWGEDSVALTDLLRWLDYSEDVCRCPTEYTVTTEFSETPYYVNLTEGFARHDDAQVSLTPEQIETIRAILDRAEAGIAVETSDCQSTP